MSEEGEKYRLTGHWAEHFLQEIERKLDAALSEGTAQKDNAQSNVSPDPNSHLGK